MPKPGPLIRPCGHLLPGEKVNTLRLVGNTMGNLTRGT